MPAMGATLLAVRNIITQAPSNNTSNNTSSVLPSVAGTRVATIQEIKGIKNLPFSTLSNRN